MEPQKNVELPRFEGGPSNIQFESSSFDRVAEIQNMNNGMDLQKSREAVFSAIDNFQQNSEVAPPIQHQSLPMVQGGSFSQAVQSPSRAADIDLMEDEWVKELKKMIIDTKGDPHMREIRFKEMQVDYLKKRYNRIINGGR